MSTGLVRSVADLFTLGEADLVTLDRFAAVSARNLVKAIDRARRPELWRFVYALGVPQVGTQTARDLAAHFGSLEQLMAAGEDDLREVSGVGPEVASAVAGFFRRKAVRRIIDRCLRRGVEPRQAAAPRRGPFAGKTVVFTGGLESVTRAEAEARVRAGGGRTSGNVSRKTDLVVAGADAGSKLDKARALGVKIVDERTFARDVGATRRIAPTSAPASGLKSMDNPTIARIFADVADLLEIQGGANVFRIRAYRNAARTVESLGASAEAAVKTGEPKLDDLPGIGKDLAGKIKEIVETGKLPLLEELKGKIPAGVLAMMRLPGLGPKRAKQIHAELGIDSLEALDAAARAGKLRVIKGLGPTLEARIVKSIADAQIRSARHRLADAEAVVGPYVTVLEEGAGHPAH